MTRNEILASFPEIKTVLKLIADATGFVNFSKTATASRDDFAFVAWRRMTSNNTGEVVFEGPCMAFYTMAEAKTFAAWRNRTKCYHCGIYTELYTVRKAA